MLLGACATNPVLSGKPQDWKGRSAEEMRAALGNPTKIIPQKDGEVWVYSKSGEFVAPAEENMRFSAAGGGGGTFMGASGGVNTTKQPQRQAEYENVWRFLVKGGKVKKWYAQRFVDGQVVWEDH